MRYDALTTLTFLALLSLAPSRATAQREAHAFLNVNVIPMDTERVLADQTVVVEDGVITAIGPAASTPVPEGATRIAARGKYLMPGLADRHAHLLSDDYIAEEYAPHELAVMVANGVTTIRHTEAIEGVMVRGRWLARRELDRMLEEAAAAMSQAPLQTE